MHVSRGAGDDGLVLKMCRAGPAELHLFLLNLYNCMLQTGDFESFLFHMSAKWGLDGRAKLEAHRCVENITFFFDMVSRTFARGYSSIQTCFSLAASSHGDPNYGQYSFVIQHGEGKEKKILGAGTR